MVTSHCQIRSSPTVWKPSVLPKPPETDKLQPRYWEAVLLGYQPGTTYYRVLDTISQKTVCTRDATFPHGANKATHIVPVRSDDVSKWELDVDPEIVEAEPATEVREAEQPEEELESEGSEREERANPRWKGWTLESDPRDNRSAAPSPEREREPAEDGPRRSRRDRGYEAAEPGFNRQLADPNHRTISQPLQPRGDTLVSQWEL